jgi:transcriptional regulator with XRE-family HTH domain
LRPACYTAGVNDEREHGEQPLDGMMKAWGLGNHDLVDASTEQLTHKQVQRARHGRTLTLAMMQKTTRALNIAVWYRLKREERELYFEYLHKHLHSYILQFSLRGLRKDRDGWSTASQAISDRIRAARRRLGLSQAQLAKLVRVSKGTLLTWETNLHSPSPTMLKRLKDVLGDGLLPSGQGNA